MSFTVVQPFMCRGKVVYFYRVYEEVPKSDEFPIGIHMDEGLWTITFDKENKAVKWLVLQMTDSHSFHVLRDLQDYDPIWVVVDDLSIEESLEL